MIRSGCSSSVRMVVDLDVLWYKGSVSDARPKGGPGCLFIVDAFNFLFRAYHALPMLTSPEGTPVNAVHGYVRMVQALRKEFAPEYLLAVFDAPGPSFRNGLYNEYKANRPPAPEDLICQIELVRGATDALGIPHTEHTGYEADDLIASHAVDAHSKGLNVIIASGDKDLMQLICDQDKSQPSIVMWDSMKNKVVGSQQVQDKFGVRPERLGDLLALAGDSVDNIPGVPGIGPKTAATLLGEFGDLEQILLQAKNLKPSKRKEKLIAHAEDARMSRKLVELCREAPLTLSMDEIRDHGIDADRAQTFFAPLGFRSTLQGIVAQVSRGRAGAKTNPAASSSSSQDIRDGLTPRSGFTLDSQKYKVFDAGQAEQLKARLNKIAERGRVAIEVMLSESDAMRADIVGIALADGQDEPCYISLGHQKPLIELGTKGSCQEKSAPQFDGREFFKILQNWISKSQLKILLNDDIRQRVALARFQSGFEPGELFGDAMLASYTLDPARSSHDIESLSLDLLDYKCMSRESVVGKGKKQIAFSDLAIPEAAKYSCERASLSFELGCLLDSQVSEAGSALEKLYRKVELPLAQVLAKMEMAGILLDGQELERQGQELGEHIQILRKSIEDQAGYSINPDSPLQLQKLLFEERGLPAKKKTKTGYSTDANVLEELSLLDPIVKEILEYRSLTKLKGTYLDSLPTMIHPATGRLHTHFRQAVAQTGRLSSIDPNLQNIPIRTELGKKIRLAFVSPPGRQLVTFDYSQIELRILAHLSGDPNLCRAFNEGADVHRRTAIEVFGIEEDQIDDEHRRVAKAVNFGVIYGQTPFGLARQLGIRQGQAGKYIKSYFEKIPGVDAYMNDLILTARKTGYAETILGRRRRIPELNRGGAAKAYGERIARNTPIQGSAADILKVAMVEVDRKLQGIDWALMLLTVHDELIFECENDRIDDLVAIIQPTMEQAVKLEVPLVVDVGHGENWGTAKA